MSDFRGQCRGRQGSDGEGGQGDAHLHGSDHPGRLPQQQTGTARRCRRTSAECDHLLQPGITHRVKGSFRQREEGVQKREQKRGQEGDYNRGIHREIVSAFERPRD